MSKIHRVTERSEFKSSFSQIRKNLLIRQSETVSAARQLNLK